MTALAFAIQAFNAIPGLITAGMDIIEFVKFINKTNDSLKEMQKTGQGPTDAQWDEFNQLIEDLRAQRPDVG